jgi:hypothetical protein
MKLSQSYSYIQKGFIVCDWWVIMPVQKQRHWDTHPNNQTDNHTKANFATKTSSYVIHNSVRLLDAAMMCSEKVHIDAPVFVISDAYWRNAHGQFPHQNHSLYNQIAIKNSDTNRYADGGRIENHSFDKTRRHHIDCDSANVIQLTWSAPNDSDVIQLGIVLYLSM